MPYKELKEEMPVKGISISDVWKILSNPPKFRKQSFSELADIVPFIGNIKAGMEFATGRDPITKERLGKVGRSIAGASIFLPGIFKGVKGAGKQAARLKTARYALRQGEGMEEIRKRTGWHIDPDDSKWRFEIDDSKSKLKITPSHLNMDKSYKLNELLEHEGLFKAYPELKNVEVYPGDFGGASQNGLVIDLGKRGSHDAVHGTLLHEVQHVVQDIEGFSRGGSPKQFKGSVLEKIESYRNLPGEKEASEVEMRKYLSVLERKNFIPRSLR